MKLGDGKWQVIKEEMEGKEWEATFYQIYHRHV